MEVNSSTDMSFFFSRSRQTCQQWLARSFSGHGLCCGARIRDEGSRRYTSIVDSLSHCSREVAAHFFLFPSPTRKEFHNLNLDGIAGNGPIMAEAACLGCPSACFAR